MNRCTFPAGCTEAATGVDAYDHPVCDLHAPMDIVEQAERIVRCVGIEVGRRALHPYGECSCYGNGTCGRCRTIYGIQK